jgi:hypothetical protein
MPGGPRVLGCPFGRTQMISDTSNVSRNLAVARSSQCHRRDENTCGATAPHRRAESVARVEYIPFPLV